MFDEGRIKGITDRRERKRVWGLKDKEVIGEG